ncbi:MAG TPA: biopolymer transporter ExbD [Rhizomicrobium sp.]|jgi:biopolymer transport protein ExbD
MSIAVHAAEADEAELNTTINTTPLVDVMLVLLIIFLITVPVVIKQVPLQLPNARIIPLTTKPENIVIAVDKDENVYWNNQPVDVSQLKDRFAAALRTAIAKNGQLPEVHIRGDRNSRFEAIGKVILACQQAGIQKVAFLTEPLNVEQ